MLSRSFPKSLSSYLNDDLPSLLQKHSIPGAGIVLLNSSDVLFMQGVGLWDIENRIPVTTLRLFAIGTKGPSHRIFQKEQALSAN